MTQESKEPSFKKFDIDKYLRLLAKRIEKDYGIELTLSEFLGLRHYSRCLASIGNNSGLDLTTLFMKDYFGLDPVHLENIAGYEATLGREKLNDKWMGNEQFKEYCRRQVHYWREQRELV